MWFIIKSDNIGKKSEDSRDLQMDIKKGREANIRFDGVGQMGTIMLEFQWNSIKESNGWANLSRPMYDQPLWNSGDSWFEAPTVRGVASVVFEIVGEASGQKWFSYADDVIFAAIDLGGGFKSAEEVGLDLAKTAATAVISYGCSELGSAASTAASKVLEGSSKIGNFAAQAGISAAQSYITTVSSSAINNMYWDTENGKIGYNTDSFVESLYSGATIGGALGAGLTAGLNEISVGARYEKVKNEKTGKMEKQVTYTRALGLSSTNIGTIQSLNGLAGGLLTNAVEYAVDGNTTFNILNAGMLGIKDMAGNSVNTGLLEINIDKKEGFTGRIGMGGTNIGINNIINSIQGAKAWNKSETINDYAQSQKLSPEETAKLANALRMQYGFGDTTQLANLDNILNGTTELEKGGTDGKAQTVSNGTNKTIYMNMTDGMDWKELGLVLGHEAYRDGVKGTKEEQRKETQSAVNGHTEMAKAMLGDYLYAEDMSKMIAGNENLQMDLFASSLGKDVFEKYVDKAYDSSADYWKQVIQSDGSTKWREDGNLDFTLEDGTVISAEDMKSTIEDIINGRTDPNGKVLREASKENNKDFQKIINQFFEGNSTGNFKDILNNINSFVNGTEAFADASIAAKLLMGKDGLSQDNINSLNVALYAAQESGLLVKNPQLQLAANNLIGGGTSDNPYFPLAPYSDGTIKITGKDGYRIVDLEMYEKVGKNGENTNYPLYDFAAVYHNGYDGIGSGPIVASENGSLSLTYSDAFGLNSNLQGGVNSYQMAHGSTDTIMNYLAQFGSSGTSMVFENGQYSISGILAGTQIATMGQTGYATGNHSHMTVNGSGSQFGNVFGNILSNNTITKYDSYAEYMTGYTFNNFYNNDGIWNNLYQYSSTSPYLNYQSILNQHYLEYEYYNHLNKLSKAVSRIYK